MHSRPDPQSLARRLVRQGSCNTKADAAAGSAHERNTLFEIVRGRLTCSPAHVFGCDEFFDAISGSFTPEAALLDAAEWRYLV
jgi:hypothetical protein